MISINKQGNAIVIEFTDNDKYLFNGKIEVAPNELIVVVDQSDMVTFKRASNGDVLFSQLVDDIQIAGSPVTKDTVIDQFAIIGFTSGGGGGTGGAVSSVNGQTGDVIITPASLNVYTRAEVDAAINEETTERQKQDSALGGMIAAETAARERAVASKQDTLVSGQNIKTINNQSLLGKGNITVEAGTSNWNDIQGKPEFAEVATTGSYNDLSDKPEIPSDYIENITDSDTEFSIDTAFNYKSGKKYSLSFSKTGGFDVVIGGVGDTQRKINLSIDTDIIATKEDLADYQPVGDYATKTELASKQDTLVSGTNIKTINGQTLLGEGNIEIQGGGTITVDSALSTTSENPVQNKVITNAINGKQDAGDYALKSEIPDTSELATKEELAAKLDTATYNSEKANFALKSELPDTSTLATKSEVTSGLATKLDVATYNVDKPTFALKTEIPDISGLATKTELSGKLDTATYNSEKASFETKENAAATYQVKGDYATTAQLNSKQDTLVSGTNIKTINGNSLLGEGDLTISSQSRTWRFTYSYSITTSDSATITPDGFTSQEWLSQVAIGDMVYLDKGQEFMKLSVSNIYHPKTGNITVGLSFYSDRLYWVYVGSLFTLKIYTVPSGETNNATALGEGAAVTASSSYGVAIGNNAKSNGYNAIVIGNNISEDEQVSINIGDYLKVSYANGFSYWDGTQMQSLKDQLATLTPPTVDTAMSDTSENAVQNKVIKKYIDDLVGNILTQLQEINGTN